MTRPRSLSVFREALRRAVALAALAVAAAWTVAAAEELEAPGPEGPLRGAYLDAGAGAQAVLIVPGSGPTNRDGDNALGIRSGAYRLLAEALAEEGVSSLRVDKRGMFRSAEAIPDANAVTIADYAADVRLWADVLRRRSGRDCVWLAGHSEGGLVVLAAAQEAEGVCGLVLLAAPGRPIGELVREQLAANPANALLLPLAFQTLDALEAGEDVDVSGLPAPLQALFAPTLQPFWRDVLSYDPAALAAAYDGPILIVEAMLDIQVAAADADALAAAAPDAVRLRLPEATHMLKRPPTPGYAGQMATYRDPSLPIDPELAPAIADFVGGR